MTSAPLVPVIVSLPGVPTMVQPNEFVIDVDAAATLFAGRGSGSVAATVAVAAVVPMASGSTLRSVRRPSTWRQEAGKGSVKYLRIRAAVRSGVQVSSQARCG